MRTHQIIAVTVAALLTLGASLPAEAMSKTQIDGYDKCRDWCYGHNQTHNSQIFCVQRCLDYWSTHTSIGPGDPPSDRIIGGAGLSGITTNG